MAGAGPGAAPGGGGPDLQAGRQLEERSARPWNGAPGGEHTAGAVPGVPELDGSRTDRPPIRLPLRGNIPTTARLRALVDSRPLQRLRGVRQLGLAQMVYPGAVHTRFEHSLGTYEMARRILGHLVDRPTAAVLSEGDVACFLVAALLHDVGHYPFSHTLEELPADPGGRFALTPHDRRAEAVVLGDEHLVNLLCRDWAVDPERVCRVIDESGAAGPAADQRLREMLCGPLNPDRLDYLERDSSHVGVPYGRVIDVERLLESLDFAAGGRDLGVTAKGVSAVETLIFASYLMYREVYWHHTVRACQAMLKRAAAAALQSGELQQADLVDLDDEQALARLLACRNPVTSELLRRLTGAGRQLYRRVYSASLRELQEGEGTARRADPALLEAVASGDYWAMQRACSEACRRLEARRRSPVEPHHLIADVAGRGKELFFSVPVVDFVRADGRTATTADADVSLIAPSLHTNFDLQAKRVQLLAPADLVGDFRDLLGVA